MDLPGEKSCLSVGVAKSRQLRKELLVGVLRRTCLRVRLGREESQ